MITWDRSDFSPTLHTLMPFILAWWFISFPVHMLHDWERERERERLKWSYQTSVMLACTGEPIYALNSVYFGTGHVFKPRGDVRWLSLPLSLLCFFPFKAESIKIKFAFQNDFNDTPSPSTWYRERLRFVQIWIFLFFVKIEYGLYFLDRFDVLMSKIIFKK